MAKDFDMDAIYKAAKAAHVDTKERKKNSGKWGFLYRSFGPKVFLRIFPLPGSVAGFYEPVLLHRVGGQKDAQYELCREYFNKKCKSCEKKEEGDKAITNQRKALALCLVKDESCRPVLQYELRLVQAPISVFEQINAALSDEEGSEGEGGFEFKDYINLKAKAKVFKVTKTGEKLDTKYGVLPCSAEKEFPVEVVKAAIAKMKEWKQFISELYAPKAAAASTKSTKDEEDEDEGEDLSKLTTDAEDEADTPVKPEKKPSTNKKPPAKKDPEEDEGEDLTANDEDDLTGGGEEEPAKPEKKPGKTDQKKPAAGKKPPAKKDPDPEDEDADPDADANETVDDDDLDNIEVDLGEDD
jgi:hypothetical protein